MRNPGMEFYPNWYAKRVAKSIWINSTSNRVNARAPTLPSTNHTPRPRLHQRRLGRGQAWLIDLQDRFGFAEDAGQ